MPMKDEVERYDDERVTEPQDSARRELLRKELMRRFSDDLTVDEIADMAHWLESYFASHAAERSARQMEKTMNNAELKQHEDAMILHFQGGVIDGCVCGLCEAVRELAKEIRMGKGLPGEEPEK